MHVVRHSGRFFRITLKREGDKPNRGPQRHFLPMPFEPPCFAADFFFNPAVLSIVRGCDGHNSREVNSMPRAVWQTLTPEQQSMMQFPIRD